MAVELGRKIVKDTQQFANYAIGITLPLTFGENTFEQSYLTKDQVKSNIKNLLFRSKKGERILQPEFGSGLQSLLFEQNVNDLEGRIEDTINESLEQWLPYVTAEQIDIESTDELRDNNRLNVSIDFRIGEDISLENVTFTVQG
jgi:phage baseplate assembly protein W